MNLMRHTENTLLTALPLATKIAALEVIFILLSSLAKRATCFTEHHIVTGPIVTGHMVAGRIEQKAPMTVVCVIGAFCWGTFRLFVYMLSDALLFPRSTTVRCSHTLSTKRFTFIAVSLQVCRMCLCVGEKKLKKLRWQKSFSWVGEKNTLLKKLLSALACAFFKSVFFCGWLFYSLINISWSKPFLCL